MAKALILLALLWLSSCHVLIETTNTTSATGAGAVATSATKTESPVASAPAATATDVDKARAPVATGAGATAADYTRAAQHGGAVATAPQARATATTQASSWGPLLVAGVAVLLLICVVWLLLYVTGFVRSGGPLAWLASKLA